MPVVRMDNAKGEILFRVRKTDLPMQSLLSFVPCSIRGRNTEEEVRGQSMGHGQKNANRGEAIQRNKARIAELATQLKNLGNLMKDMKREGMDEMNEIMVVMDEVHEAFEERVRLLERPWWKKLLRMDLEIEKEVEDAEEKEAEVAADAEPPASGSGPEDTGTGEEEVEAEQEEGRVS